MKKIIAFICSIFLLINFLNACAPIPPDGPSSSGTPDTDVLNIYLDSYTKGYMQCLLDQFSLENENVSIEITDLSSLNMEDFSTKLASDLIAGKGPDIILVSNAASTRNTFFNLTKLLQSNVFLDINELNVDLSACSQQVLAAGKYLGKQYMLPLNYSLGMMLTSSERLAEYGIVIDEGLEKFSSSVASIYEDGKFVFPNYFTSKELYSFGGKTLIDYNNNTFLNLSETQPYFESLIRCYDNLFPNILTSASPQNYSFSNVLKNYNYSVKEAFLAGDLVFLSDQEFLGTYQNLSYMNAIIDELIALNETPVLFSLPTLDKATPAPMINYFLLVNKNASDNEAVRKFIESAIGEESQYSYASQTGIPVNIEIVHDMQNYYEGASSKYSYANYCSIPEEVSQSYFETIENMSDGVYQDVQISSCIFSVFREYVSSNDMHYAYNSGKERLEFYLNE